MSQETQWFSDRRKQFEVVIDALNVRHFEVLTRMAFDPELEFRSVLAVSEGTTYRGIEGLAREGSRRRGCSSSRAGAGVTGWADTFPFVSESPGLAVEFSLQRLDAPG
jgi:hypothetical protein